MRLLLDTHLLLWSMGVTRRLSRTTRNLLLDPANTVLFSAASVWEIAIKSGLRRRDFKVELPGFVRALERAGFSELPISTVHAMRVAQLPDIHKDPFDRLLVAQALVEPAVLLTIDAQLRGYGPQVRVL